MAQYHSRFSRARICYLVDVDPGAVPLPGAGRERWGCLSLDEGAVLGPCLVWCRSASRTPMGTRWRAVLLRLGSPAVL